MGGKTIEMECGNDLGIQGKEMQLRELSEKKEVEPAAGMWSGQEAQKGPHLFYSL